jgi:polyisoprenoid-binding protein YceI
MREARGRLKSFRRSCFATSPAHERRAAAAARFPCVASERRTARVVDGFGGTRIQARSIPMKISIAVLTVALAALAALTVQAEPYTIDPKHTFESFEINHFGLSTLHGRFDKTSGTLNYDPANKTGSVDVTIEVASVTTGNAERDAHLQKPEFFDAANHPTIKFKSKPFRFEGDQLKAVEGDLTIRGVTKPMTLNVTRAVCTSHPLLKIPACGADADATIKRSDFGVSAYLPGIGDEVKLHLDIEALKQK